MSEKESEIIVGKHVLESLSIGMYSDPFDIYREYIQNACDSIDEAYEKNILAVGEGIINIEIGYNFISIKDNGMGLPKDQAYKKLADVGNSQKKYNKNRGFRGIGRLGGLSYASTVTWITSALGEPHKTIMTWNCTRLKERLNPNHQDIEDMIGVIKAVTSYNNEVENENEHYFEVRLEGINKDDFPQLLDTNAITQYLAKTAPVDFDSQIFPFASQIKKEFCKNGYDIPCYKILLKGRGKPIYKLYSSNLNTGHRAITKTTDYIKSIEFAYETTQNGHPLYAAWLAITDFSGQINDENIYGIRLRKGNILIGGNTTFSRYFPSEGNVANKMFIGEIHILHSNIVPNAKRDDFEPGPANFEMTEKLKSWAQILNKNYRRGTSEISSAMRNMQINIQTLESLATQVKSGAITSDVKRDKLRSELSSIHKNIFKSSKILAKANIINDDPERKEKITSLIKKAEFSEKKALLLDNEIVNADYATKNDLPTSYSKSERNVYQRIITVIDEFFADQMDLAAQLRTAIKTALNEKKK